MTEYILRRLRVMFRSRSLPAYRVSPQSPSLGTTPLRSRTTSPNEVGARPADSFGQADAVRDAVGFITSPFLEMRSSSRRTCQFRGQQMTAGRLENARPGGPHGPEPQRTGQGWSDPPASPQDGGGYAVRELLAT